MIELAPSQVTPPLAALFDLQRPTMPRAFTVLEGLAAGQVVTDDPLRPSWAAVREATYGTLYLGGALTPEVVAGLVDHFRRLGDVGIGCWPEAPLAAMLPPDPDYDGRTLFFPDRSRAIPLDTYVERLPPGCRLVPRDARLAPLSPDYADALVTFGSLEAMLAHTLGFMLLRGDALLCEAGTGAPALGRIEVGVVTDERHRRHGYATITCARLIQECEARGFRTWWDCAEQNLPSVALARKLGYHGERAYRFVFWSQRL